MSDFGGLVEESLALFKKGQLEPCHDKLAEAFELSWEDGMKADKHFEGKALELFPEEVEFWRHLVESLSTMEKVNPKAVQMAWKGLNERVLLPERVDVLAKSFAQMGDLEKARQLCPDMEWKEIDVGFQEHPITECKLPLSDITPNGYALMLLRLYESIVSGQKGKLDSVFSPLLFSFDHSLITSMSSQPDSTVQSSQDASQLNSPAKKRRPVRQIVRRRSQDLEKMAPKVTLPDLLCELFPIEVGQWWQSNQAIVNLKTHLLKMNEQKANLATRIVEFCKEGNFENISFGNLRQLLLLCAVDMNCRDDEFLQACAKYIPFSTEQTIAQHTSVDSIDSQAACFQSFSEALELIKAQNQSAARAVIDRIDYTSCLNDVSVQGELKYLIIHVLNLMGIKIDYDSLVKKFGEQFWLPMEDVIHHCSSVDPILAAKLLLTNTELPAPSLLINIVKSEQSQLCMERLLDYLDQNSMLMANDALLAREIVDIVKSDHKEVTWNLFRAMYRLPMAIGVNSKFSSDVAFTSPPTTSHIRDMLTLIQYYWDNEDDKLNMAETEDLLRWLLENVQVPNITRRLVEFNINALRGTLRTFTRDICKISLPKPVALPESEVLNVFRMIVDLLYNVQSDQFVNKRRSPDWLQSYKTNLKLHWSLFNNQSILSDLGLCFHALCKYAVTSFEAASLSTLLPKLKRKLKRSLICFELSQSRLVERLEVLEFVLQPGLLQFELEEAVRSALTQTYLSLIQVALEKDGEWRWWYLLGEALYSVNSKAALPPLRTALKLAGNDIEAQCIVYQLYYQCLPNDDKLQCELAKKMEELEKANNFHRLVHCKYLLSLQEQDKEAALSALLPFLAKPRVSGLSNLKQSGHDRPGDYYNLQERYLSSAIDYYRNNVGVLLQIAQRVKTCGVHHLISPDTAIMACAEHVSVFESASVEDKKKMVSFLRDMPKGERRDNIMKRLTDPTTDETDQIDT